MVISVVVPCYNEEAAIPFFYEEFIKLADETMKEQTFELLLINDGSKDNTLGVMKELAIKDGRVKYVSFSRNFGKEAAIYAGLKYSKGDYVAIMDADLQDPPAMLPEMFKAVTEEGYDSVATRRVTRKGEPPIRSFFARKFYKIMNKISDSELVDGARDYRLMSRKFVSAILSLGEYNRFSKGLFGWVGFKTKWLEYENVERVAGETKWSFRKLFFYALDGIVAFSTAPLDFSAFVGFGLSVLSVFAILFIIIRKLIFGDSVQGWASLISVILFVGGIQMMFIGIIGRYLAKTYSEVKKRPIFILGETNCEENDG